MLLSGGNDESEETEEEQEGSEERQEAGSTEAADNSPTARPFNYRHPKQRTLSGSERRVVAGCRAEGLWLGTRRKGLYTRC